MKFLYYFIAFFIILQQSPMVAAAAPDDGEIVFDEEEGEKNKPESEEQETQSEKPAPVNQVVEHTADEQGLLRSMDEYDAQAPYEKMRKNIPKFHVDAAFGPAIGIAGLSSHAGPAIRLAGLWRIGRYFGWGVAFDTQFLMGKGVSRPGFSPALTAKFFIPLRRRHYLTPKESWEIGLQAAAGYIEQGLVRDNLKWVAQGIYLNAAMDLSYWYTTNMRFFGRVEFASPFWTELCEESSATRHCETRERFDGRMLAILAGVSFAIF